MARKHKNYIREWRKKAGYTQKEVIDRLRELAGGDQVDPDFAYPTTEASLSV
jgi:transcriptional regulator with XRE-family HTH domain